MLHASTPSRTPTKPSSGGLLQPGFVYRTAEKTDVRVTWERAKAQLKASHHAQSSHGER